MEVLNQDAHTDVRLKWHHINEEDETGCCKLEDYWY